MKIISLSSSIAGPACAVACSIKKYFYHNNYQTNIFDTLEISMSSIIQILYLKDLDINYLSNNNEISPNKDGNYSVKFNNFDKIICHHDLPNNYTTDDYNNFIEKYKRRYKRFINDITNQNTIFFIRYGCEDVNIILNFINTVNNINPNLKIYFINIFYDISKKSIEINEYYKKNIFYVNFFDYVDYNFKYSDDLFFKTIQFNWKIVYDIIYNNLDEHEKEHFKYST